MAWLALAGAARGQIVVDHEPTRLGGPSSDTDFIYFGQPAWQLEADNINIASPAIVRQVTWWGFYDRDNPPASETMRIRFYDSRPGDGLPGDILFEQSILNASRVYTGHFVLADVRAREFVFTVDLTQPFHLDAATQYWLEIAQIGDPTTAYRWESGFGPQDGHAFINNREVDWQWTGPGIDDFAFRLSTIPEPGIVAIMGPAMLIFLGRKRGGARNANAPVHSTLKRGH